MRLVVYLFFLSSFFVSAQNSLTSDFDAVISYSSTRTNGLKSDREDNTVVGCGIYGFASYYGAVALDGSDGSLSWLMESKNKIFLCSIHHNFNGYNINVEVVAVRDAELRMIDAVDGSLIWKFWNYSTIHPKDSAWNNFYCPQVIDDLNNNDISDLLCPNVGGYSLDSFVNLEDLSSVINN